MIDEAPDIRTYSRRSRHVGTSPEMKDGARWLSHRLNRGELSGYRVGRRWRMTRDDVDDLIERHRNRPRQPITTQVPQADSSSGLTTTSRRRLGRGNL
ncbi:MAG: helix-turn-helix domain-containing protein, partial [Mycobacterium sp.]